MEIGCLISNDFRKERKSSSSEQLTWNNKEKYDIALHMTLFSVYRFTETFCLWKHLKLKQKSIK